jgi:hypothetical protein
MQLVLGATVTGWQEVSAGGGIGSGGQQDLYGSCFRVVWAAAQRLITSCLGFTGGVTQVNLEGPVITSFAAQLGANYNTFSNKPAYALGTLILMEEYRQWLIEL